MEPPNPQTDEAQPASAVTRRATPPDLPETELGLEARYHLPSTSRAERMEVIRALGEFQTLASAGVLARIFAREKYFDAKMKVLEVIADNREETCREVKLSILCAAVADTQSRQVRLAALQALLDVDDPRLPQILRKIAADRDPLIRSQVAEALRE